MILWTYGGGGGADGVESVIFISHIGESGKRKKKNDIYI